LLHNQKLEIEAIQNCIFIKDKNPKIALSSNLAYNPGDKITLSQNTVLSGFIGSSGKNVIFFVPLNKSIDNIASIEVSCNNFYVRTPNGLRLNGVNIKDTDTYTVTTTKSQAGFVVAIVSTNTIDTPQSPAVVNGALSISFK
jgi:hypothetical protein